MCRSALVVILVACNSSTVQATIDNRCYFQARKNLKPNMKSVPLSEASSCAAASDCDNELHIEAPRNGLYIYAIVADTGELVYIGFTRKHRSGNDQTAFFPLLPPDEIAQQIYASLKVPDTDSGRSFYPWPPVEFTLNTKGVIEYNGSFNGRHRYLPCVSRQHAADILFKVIVDVVFFNIVPVSSNANKGTVSRNSVSAQTTGE
jgi:hypothetical protein